MATKVTTKKPLTGNRRSHALNATKMKQKPNLQKKTINGEQVIISAREARTLNKKAACILSVTDSLVKPEELTPMERQTALTNMIKLGLETAIKL